MKIIAVLLAFIVLSCNQPFSPKAPFDPHLVVYSVIYTDLPRQFVRVYSTYDVSGYDPYRNTTDGAITGAAVSVSGPQGTFLFRDTLLQRPEPWRYKTPISAYVADWRPQPGQSYTLKVDAGPAGLTQSTVFTPPVSGSRSWYPVDPTLALDFPDTSTIATYVSAIFQFSASTRAISQQLYILYTVQSGDGSEQEMVTQLLGKNVGAANGDYVGVACSRTGIAATIHGIAKTFAGSKLTFKRIVFRLMQMEKNWNEYYNIVRLPQDTMYHSTRFDQPDFTNLSSGYGLFGACTVDSLVHDYPANFRYNH